MYHAVLMEESDFGAKIHNGGFLALKFPSKNFFSPIIGMLRLIGKERVPRV